MNETFVVRIKPDKRDRVPEALAEGCLIVGWQEVPQILDRAMDRAEVRSEISAAYYPDERYLHKAGSATRNLWNFLRVMKKRDIALVPHLGKCFYVARVIGDPYHDPSPQKGGFKRAVKWLNEGRPFSREEEPEVFARLREQPTCYELRTHGYPFLTEFLERVSHEDSAAGDIEVIVGDRSLDATTRSALIEARIGQGDFRKRLLVTWNNKCAVTGCAVLSAIRASHVKPWRLCSNDERLDPSNGLPLLATLDALFDAELISFDEEGRMLVADKLGPRDREALGLPAPLRMKPSVRLNAYLEDHRRRFHARNRI